MANQRFIPPDPLEGIKQQLGRGVPQFGDPAVPITSRGPFPDQAKEQAFQEWYRQNYVIPLGLDPDPDSPLQQFDYREAFEAGVTPGSQGHSPSQFKLAGHPNRFVGGQDTATGLPLPTNGVSRQLARGISPTVEGAAAQAPSTPLNGIAPTGGDGGIFQKILQLLQLPAFQRTAGAIGSAVAGPRELEAFQRQTLLNQQGETVRLSREAAGRRETREVDTASRLDKRLELDVERLEEQKRQNSIASKKTLIDLSSKGFDVASSAEILGIQDLSVIEAAGKFKPKTRYVDTSTGKLLKEPTESSIGPFTPGDAFRIGMDVKKFNRGGKTNISYRSAY